MRNRRYPRYPDDNDYTTNSPSYYDDLARKQKLIELLAKKIWEYEETLNLTLEQITTRLESYIEENDNLMNDRLEQWDLNLEKFPENVELLLEEWLTDGTLDHIINETIFNWKADKTYVDSEIERLDQKDENLTTQLAQTEQRKADKDEVYLKIDELDINDFNEETRQSILENNQMDINYVLGNGNVKNENLADGVVTSSKVTEKMDGNILNKDEFVLGGYWYAPVGEKPNLSAIETYYYKREPIHVISGQVVRFSHAAGSSYYIGVDSTGTVTQLASSMSTIGETAITVGSGTVAFYVSVRYEAINEAMITIDEPLPTTYQPYYQRKQLDWLKVAPENISSDLKVLPRHIDREHSVNLFDHTTVTDNYLVGLGGELISFTGYCVSDYIKVNRDSRYKITSNRPSTLMALYDGDKNFMRLINGETSDDLHDTFAITAMDFDYIRININKNLVNLEQYVVSLVEDFDTADGKIPWLRIDNDNLSPNFEFSESSGGTNKELNRFKDLNLLVSGDSITEKNVRADKNWHDFLKDWLDLKVVYNDAKSGTGLVKPFEQNEAMLDRLQTWETKYGTSDDIDMILIMGNMNDGTTASVANTNKWSWIYGDNDIHKDDFDTVVDLQLAKQSHWMAMRYLIEQLIIKYPNQPIGFITSQPRSVNITKSGTPRDGFSSKCWGVDGWFSEWVDVILKICGHYSIPVLDLYHNSGLRPWNTENNNTYFSSGGSSTGDGVHPNAFGQELMAQKIYEFVKQYM